jgi:mannose-6-phosphate isomerase-like protein (cupin superfamily)
VSYRWVSADDLEYEERPPKPGEGTRRTADLTAAVELKQSRARLWRYPPRSTGRRHQDHVQEEVFVVVQGTLTMLLGGTPENPEPERVDLGPGGVVSVDPMTPLQMRNETDEELVVFAYGAPPIREGADMLDDVELPERAAAPQRQAIHRRT